MDHCARGCFLAACVFVVVGVLASRAVVVVVVVGGGGGGAGYVGISVWS